MRLFAVLVAICALSQTATAQTPQCKLIAHPETRLACYDKAAPLAAKADKSAAPTAAAKRSEAKAPERYVDAISAEDAKMNARLRNICRGC